MTGSRFSQHQLALLIVLASIGVTVLQATNLGCRPGEKLYEGRCYGVYRPSSKCPHDFNQTAAEDFCQANGGELASIHSQAQNDFITALIKSTQHAAAKKAAAKAKCGGCQVPEKDYLYWIGLELSHRANGTVNGASWTDGTSVNYGNPTSAAFRPPFVTGRPVGSAGDGRDPLEVCPLGNENKCVQIYGYGSTVGKWTDKHCANQHAQNVTCGCPEEEAGNRTAVAHHNHHHSSSSSSSAADEEDVLDECRDEAALNGIVCQTCPLGWTPFQGHCYLATDGGTVAQSHATCEGYGAKVSSIHSAAENVFVLNLGQARTAGANNLIGLSLTHASNAVNAPVTSAQWSDGTPVDYANPMVAPWSARGVYPWGQGQINIIYPPQPDNVVAPGNCVFMYAPGSQYQGPGEWEDTSCSGLATALAVCKLQ